MAINQFLAAQLRKPSGLFGSFVLGRLMNLGNRELILSTIAQLQLSSQHIVLEIGFGGGSGLKHLANRLTNGKAIGIDYSPEMVRSAQQKLRRQISEGHIEVQLGDISSLQFHDGVFDRVFTVNTIYFWPDVPKGFSEIRRVLRHGGQAAVSLRSKEKMQRASFTKDGFRLFSPKDVATLMQEAGFREVRIHHSNCSKLADNVIVLGMN